MDRRTVLLLIAVLAIQLSLLPIAIAAQPRAGKPRVDDPRIAIPGRAEERRESTGAGGLGTRQQLATLLWSVPAGSVSESVTYDLNGDGYDDLVTVDWDNGYVTAIEGDTGTIMWQVQPEIDSSQALDIGDVTGDGEPDIVVGYIYSSMIYVLDKDDGSTIWSTTAPDWICDLIVISDVNGDGYNDIVVSVDYYSPHVSCYGGGVTASAGQLWGYTFPSSTTAGSYRVDKLGDVNGDGIEDVVALANFGYGYTDISAIDGASGTEIWHQDPVAGLAAEYGLTVDDLDGDGDMDVAVGATNQNVYMFDAATGIQLAASPLTAPGEVLDVATGDFDGDGSLELAAAHGWYLPCGVTLFDPVTGSVECTWDTGYADDVHTPFYVELFDCDGDPAEEVVGILRNGDIYVLDGCTLSYYYPTGATIYVNGHDLIGLVPPLHKDSSDYDGALPSPGIWDIGTGAWDAGAFCITTVATAPPTPNWPPAGPGVTWNVLIVMDDDDLESGEELEPETTFTDAIDQANAVLGWNAYSYTVMHTSSPDWPTAQLDLEYLFMDYPVIIWELGTETDAMTAEEASALAYYLSAGGTLIVDSGEFGWDHQADVGDPIASLMGIYDWENDLSDGDVFDIVAPAHDIFTTPNDITGTFPVTVTDASPDLGDGDECILTGAAVGVAQAVPPYSPDCYVISVVENTTGGVTYRAIWVGVPLVVWGERVDFVHNMLVWVKPPNPPLPPPVIGELSWMLAIIAAAVACGIAASRRR